MPPIAITESKMTFGPFKDENVFYIEKSRIYQENKFFKIAEFFLVTTNSNDVKIIEAKSSSPKPENAESFDSFLSEISEKLSNSLSFWISLKLKRHSNGFDEMPASFQKVDLSNASFKFILVIKGHKEEWLPPIKDALAQKLKVFCKIWNLKPDPVVVLNHEWAIHFQLIQ